MGVPTVNYCHLAAGLVILLAVLLFTPILAQDDVGSGATCDKHKDCVHGFCVPGAGGVDECDCNIGYLLDSEGKCTILQTCITPGDPTMATQTSPVKDPYEYGDQVTYACNDGYELATGNLRRTCQSDGFWSGLPPTCTVKDCGDPTKGLLNAVITTDPIETIYGSTVESSCLPGYVQRSGDAVRTCLKDGKWSKHPMKCTPVHGCHQNPDVCQNGGDCEDIPGGVQCICPTSTSGDFCEIPDPNVAVRIFDTQATVVNPTLTPEELSDPTSPGYQEMLKNITQDLSDLYKKTFPGTFRGIVVNSLSPGPNGGVVVDYDVGVNPSFAGTGEDLLNMVGQTLLDNKFLYPSEGRQYQLAPDTMSISEQKSQTPANLLPLFVAMALAIPTATILSCFLAAWLRRNKRKRRTEESEEDDDTAPTTTTGQPLFGPRLWQPAPSDLPSGGSVNPYDNQNTFSWNR